MHTETAAPVIGLMNGQRDLVGLMRMVLELEGYQVISAEMGEDADPMAIWRFNARVQPDVLIWNLTPSVDRRVVQTLQPWMVGDESPRVLFTSADPARLTALIGPSAENIVISIPFDIDALINRVERALQRAFRQDMQIMPAAELANSRY